MTIYTILQWRSQEFTWMGVAHWGSEGTMEKICQFEWSETLFWATFESRNFIKAQN